MLQLFDKGIVFLDLDISANLACNWWIVLRSSQNQTKNFNVFKTVKHVSNIISKIKKTLSVLVGLCPMRPSQEFR